MPSWTPSAIRRLREVREEGGLRGDDHVGKQYVFAVYRGRCLSEQARGYPGSPRSRAVPGEVGVQLARECRRAAIGVEPQGQNTRRRPVEFKVLGHGEIWGAGHELDEISFSGIIGLR